MRTQTSHPVWLEERTIPVQAKLAALWASLVLVYIYVDILSLYQPGVIDDIRAGRVWQFDITQTWAVGALALMAVPILMVALSLMLPARANRLTNLTVATIYTIVSVTNAIGESWVYYFAFAVGLELIVLGLVLRYAWTWPRTQPRANSDHRTTADQQLVRH